MAKITILGGTGFTGSNLAREAVGRGHSVTSFSRNLPDSPIDGVIYETGSLLDDAVQRRAVNDTDVVVASLAPRGELADTLTGVYDNIQTLSAQAGVRLGVIGGFGSLRPAEGAPRFAEGDALPEEFRAEAKTMAGVVEGLKASAPESLDWFFVSPAGNYGAHAPGESTGNYRVGGEVALFDAAGNSAISGADFAAAVIDELENPKHQKVQFSVAY